MTTQARKPAIIKETQIIVESVRLDDYGNLWVLDKNGDETKIAQKRSHLFPIFQPERGVNLYWAKYMDKLYVAEAQPLGDMISAPAEKPTLTTETPDQAEIDASAGKPPARTPAPQEVGMWFKEAGEMIRAKDIKQDHPMYHDLRNAYYKKMFEVLGIPMRHKEDAQEMP